MEMKEAKAVKMAYVVSPETEMIFEWLSSDDVHGGIASAILQAEIEADAEVDELQKVQPEDNFTRADFLPEKLGEQLEQLVQEMLEDHIRGDVYFDITMGEGDLRAGFIVVNFFKTVDFFRIACMILDGVKPEMFDHRTPM